MNLFLGGSFHGGPPLGGLMQIMFPDSHHPPIGPTQGLVHQPVAGDVAGKFVFPESPVALRLRAMHGTAMPETAVHEYCRARFEEDKIRAHL